MSDRPSSGLDHGARQLTRAMTALGLGLLAALATKILIWPPDDPDIIWITWYFLRRQDAPMLVLGAADVDIVLIDDDGVPHGHDFVRNDPFLRNRPIRLYAWFLKPGQLEALCGRYRMALFGREHIDRFGLFATPDPMVERSRLLREKLASLSCAPAMK